MFFKPANIVFVLYCGIALVAAFSIPYLHIGFLIERIIGASIVGLIFWNHEWILDSLMPSYPTNVGICCLLVVASIFLILLFCSSYLMEFRSQGFDSTLP